MSKYINLDDDRLMQILYDEACAEGNRAERIYKKLCEIADADVQPVRRGEWEHTCVCSECGQIDYSAPNYCPNCGSYNGEEEEKL